MLQILKRVKHLSHDNLPKLKPDAEHLDVLWKVKGIEELSCRLGQKEAQQQGLVLQQSEA